MKAHHRLRKIRRKTGKTKLTEKYTTPKKNHCADAAVVVRTYTLTYLIGNVPGRIS
jgi:hypothetical protein